jgi:hypothetical protein
MITILVISANLRLKNWRFLENQRHGPIFAQTSKVFEKKRQFFSSFFGKNILKIIQLTPEYQLFGLKNWIRT